MQTWDVRSLEVEPHSPKVLHSNDEGRTIVINLPAGEELGEHEVHERSWVFIVDGEIELEGAGETVKGGAGLPRTPRPEGVERDPRGHGHEVDHGACPWPGEGHPSQKASGQGR